MIRRLTLILGVLSILTAGLMGPATGDEWKPGHRAWYYWCDKLGRPFDL